MRCSDCSKDIRPIVACDIDETLGLYHSHFHEFAEGYLGRSLPVGFDGSTEFWRWLGIDLFLYRQIKLAYRQGGMKRSMPVKDGARDFMCMAKDLGAEIWITTTRPYMRLDNIDPDTRHWMEHNGLPFDFMLYDEDKYAQLDDLVDNDRVVFLLDDLPEQVERGQQIYGGRMHQAWGPTNRCVPARWSPGCPTLGAAADSMAASVEEWYQRHKERT